MFATLLVRLAYSRERDGNHARVYFDAVSSTWRTDVRLCMLPGPSAFECGVLDVDVRVCGMGV